MNDFILSVRGISKSFFSVPVLNNINLDITEGDVHAIVGENGAGKSTLIKIIGGALKQDSGEIMLNEKKLNNKNPAEAQRNGISIIHQELTVFNNLNGAENIFLGREPQKFGVINKKILFKKSQELINTLKPGLPIDISINSLSPAEREIIQIARALSFNSKIIIMDEPTASLSSTEVNQLFKVIKLLKDRKVTIIYITHRLEELDEIADKVTVLKDGVLINTLNKEDINRAKIVFLMTGKKQEELYFKENRNITDNILSIEKFNKKNSFTDIGFEVKKGEILGITGLVGSQKTELARSIFGLEKYESGKIKFNNKYVNIPNARKAISLGIGYVPEERQSQILFLSMTVKNNLILGVLDRLSKFYIIIDKKAKELSKKMIEKFDIKPNNPNKLIKNLSGGNQQKVAIARWIPLNPKLLILDEPTRGVDVGARKEIYEMINNIAKNNNGIIFISSDINEVANVCDRAIIMSKGKVIASYEKTQLNEEILLKTIMGAL